MRLEGLVRSEQESLHLGLVLLVSVQHDESLQREFVRAEEGELSRSRG